nr:DUF6708 domain-containing protein [uncultured Halomonas sp.]
MAFQQASWGGLILALFLIIACHHHLKARSALPTRFNRQRREVYFVPEDGKAPIVVPWESVAAWVTQAQGVTQYGMQRQYGLGIGFYDHATRQPHHLEMPMPGLPLALGLWEAIRGYMEYEVNSLQEIQDPQGLQRPGDPPHEGVHTFYNARDRLHRRYRDGEIGLFRVTMWYLWHVIDLWTIPHHVTEWEIRAIQKAGLKALPEVMQAWSQPLPENEWARPSEELKRLSAEVDALYQRRPPGEITEIFAEVYKKEKLTA